MDPRATGVPWRLTRQLEMLPILVPGEGQGWRVFVPQMADCHWPGLTLVVSPQVPLSCCALRQGDFVLPDKALRPSHAGSWKVTWDTELVMRHRQHPDQHDNGKTVAKEKLFLNLVINHSSRSLLREEHSRLTPRQCSVDPSTSQSLLICTEQGARLHTRLMCLRGH